MTPPRSRPKPSGEPRRRFPRATNGAASWGWVARLLHWGMAGLIMFQLGLGLWMANFVPDLIERFRLTQLHKSWGFVIFALALARIVWRLGNRTAPPPPLGVPTWQVRAATASHVFLYALMLVLPLSGWVMSAAAPTQDLLAIENTVFGWFALPDPWIPGVRSVETAARVVHVWSAALLALLVLAHAGAALTHQFVHRDDVLARMTWRR